MSTTNQKKLRCKRPGCLKYYREQQNVQGVCHHHSGQPIFHDTKKGWTCCNKIVYDWDQFQKLPTCSTGLHTDIKVQDKFYKSSTVSNASNALIKSQSSQAVPIVKPIVIKDINQYNKQQQQKKLQSAAKQKQLFKTKQNKLRCINQGCRKDYLEEENGQEACGYHKGEAVFHDLKKYWNCCKKQTHDWDDFMKLPTCCKGWHSPKYI